MLAPSLSPRPERMGAMMTLPLVTSVAPTPPTRYADPSTPVKVGVEVLRRTHLVDEEKRLGALAADVEPERRPVPVHLLRSSAAQVQRALAVAHAGEERAAAFGSQDVPGRTPAVAEDVLDHRSEAGRHLPEEARARRPDFVDGVTIAFGRRCRILAGARRRTRGRRRRRDRDVARALCRRLSRSLAFGGRLEYDSRWFSPRRWGRLGRGRRRGWSRLDLCALRLGLALQAFRPASGRAWRACSSSWP